MELTRNGKIILICSFMLIIAIGIGCNTSDNNNQAEQTQQVEQTPAPPPIPPAPDTISSVTTTLAPLRLIIKTETFKVYEFGAGSDKVNCNSGYVLTDNNGKPVSISIH